MKKDSLIETLGRIEALLRLNFFASGKVGSAGVYGTLESYDHCRQSDDPPNLTYETIRNDLKLLGLYPEYILDKERAANSRNQAADGENGNWKDSLIFSVPFAIMPIECFHRNDIDNVIAQGIAFEYRGYVCFTEETLRNSVDFRIDSCVDEPLRWPKMFPLRNCISLQIVAAANRPPIQHSRTPK